MIEIIISENDDNDGRPLKSWYIGHLKFVCCILPHEMCILANFEDVNWHGKPVLT